VDQRTRLNDGDVEALLGIPVAKPEMGHQSSALRASRPLGLPQPRAPRPMGSVNRYTGALKELFLLAAENVGDRTEIGPNGERHGEGGALAYLETSAITERKTFLTVMARLLPITIKTAPPLKKVLTQQIMPRCLENRKGNLFLMGCSQGRRARKPDCITQPIATRLAVPQVRSTATRARSRNCSFRLPMKSATAKRSGRTASWTAMAARWPSSR
jgi:hypothetical protein